MIKLKLGIDTLNLLIDDYCSTYSDCYDCVLNNNPTQCTNVIYGNVTDVFVNELLYLLIEQDDGLYTDLVQRLCIEQKINYDEWLDFYRQSVKSITSMIS